MARCRSGSSAQAGFTLAEMLVVLAMTAVLLLGVLFTFDFNSRVARAQTNVSDLQQSLRIAQDDLVRFVRMTGRGNLPLAAPPTMPLPQGFAMAVRNQVPAGQFMVNSDPTTRILQDTDVLTVRGVFGPLYYVNVSGSATFDGDPNNPTNGTLIISDESPGVAKQDLAPIKAAIDAANKDGTTEAILLVAAQSDEVRAVVELNGGTIAEHQVVINFRITDGARSVDYLKLSTGGAFQKAVQNVNFAGILEEHRYYIREEHDIAGDLASDLTPKLSRARFYPGTTEVYKGDAGNARLDLADNIADLQVSLAFDTATGGSGHPLLETADGANDDWLFNNSGDDANLPIWQALPAIQYVRVMTLARSDRRDPAYQAPLLVSDPKQPAVLPGGRLEDHAYPTNHPFNSYAARMYRWQTLRTVIDLRNL
jgi:prepilin-type N-terminal cleavage/methylation domain-containing protein